MIVVRLGFVSLSFCFHLVVVVVLARGNMIIVNCGIFQIYFPHAA